MAAICPVQLLLLSLLSSSFHFLRSAHAQSSPAHFRSRLSKLRTTQTVLIGQLSAVPDSDNQNVVKIRTNGGMENCEHDCDLYSSFSKTASIPNSAFISGISQTYLKAFPMLKGIRQNVPKDSIRRPEYAGLPNSKAVMQTRKGDKVDTNTTYDSYVKQNVEKISSLPSTDTLQWMWKMFVALSTDSNSFSTDSHKDSGDFPPWDFDEFEGENSRMETERMDASDRNYKVYGSGNFKDNDTNQEAKIDFDLRENNYAELENDDLPWAKSKTDFLEEKYISRLDPLPAVTDESENQRTYLGNDFSSSVPQSLLLDPLWIRDASFYSGRVVPSSGRETHSNPDHPKETSRTEAVSVSKRITMPFTKQVFVHGNDDRHRVLLPQMRKFPFSNIARLSTGCTGTLVTPRHVLTAAHCVHNGFVFKDNLEKLKIEIPDTMGFKNYYAQKITVPNGWLRENQIQVWSGGQSGKRAVYDYAVVHLTLAVAGRTRFLPLAVPRPEVLQMDFYFLAFPKDDQQLWRSVCLASQHMALGDGNLIMTRCDTAVGNSGAAVFIQDPHYGGLRVVGILSNTRHVGHHRSFYRYSIITALTWSKLTHICQELDALGQLYNVCPPERYMRRSSNPRQIELQVIPFFGKRAAATRRRRLQPVLTWRRSSPRDDAQSDMEDV